VKVLIQKWNPNHGTTHHFRKPTGPVMTSNGSSANTPNAVTAAKLTCTQQAPHVRQSYKLRSVQEHTRRQMHTHTANGASYLHFLHILGPVLAQVEMPEQPMPDRSHPPQGPHGGFHCKPSEALGSIVHVWSEWLPSSVDYQPARTTYHRQFRDIFHLTFTK
jgi:hypothetical protein